MIRLWSGFYKPLSFRERSSSHVIIDVSRAPASVVNAGDIVHVDNSGYFKIVGEPNPNSERLWFEAQIGRCVKAKEVRQRTRQKYQLENLQNWYSMCERNGDTEDLEIIDRHIKLCMEDSKSDAALVGWVRCMENITEDNLEAFKRLHADAAERRRQTVEYGMTEMIKRYDSEIEELDYQIEAKTALLQWKHPGLCAHAWDCDEY